MNMEYNVIWDLDDKNTDERNTFLEGEERFNMKCNKCFEFLSFVRTPENIKIKFCPNCGNKIELDEKEDNSKGA